MAYPIVITPEQTTIKDDPHLLQKVPLSNYLINEFQLATSLLVP